MVFGFLLSNHLHFNEHFLNIKWQEEFALLLENVYLI